MLSDYHGHGTACHTSLTSHIAHPVSPTRVFSGAKIFQFFEKKIKKKVIFVNKKYWSPLFSSLFKVMWFAALYVEFMVLSHGGLHGATCIETVEPKQFEIEGGEKWLNLSGFSEDMTSLSFFL